MIASLCQFAWFRKSLATTLCAACLAPLSLAQDTTSQTQAITPVRPRSPIVVRPYQAPLVPEVQLSNSSRLAGLIRAGKLYLTAQDAIALALENNIDVEVARYQPILDSWNLERAEAGGALPGVPSGASQAGTVARGQGVAGSQAAAGVSAGGRGGNGNNTANATISQIGPVTPNLDPVFQDTTSFSHRSSPQANSVQSQVINYIQNTRTYTTSLQEGFVTGGQATLTYSESYLNENAPTDVLNPSYAPILELQVQHNFLQGFGKAVNSRTINIYKTNLQIDDLNFKSQVISVVANVLNLYYGLAADYEDVRAKQQAVTVAQQFFENNKKQVEVGTMAPLDVTTAEAQAASSEQDLVIAETTLQQQQVQLKNVLSRIGTADPLLTNVEIIPLDHIVVPEQDNLPPLKDLIAEAAKNRVDIASQKLNLQVAQLNALGTENGVRPQLAAFASTSQAGSSGTQQYVTQSNGQSQGTALVPCPPPRQGSLCETADPYFVGGLGNGLGQMFRRNFPTNSAGVFFAARLRNRQSQADFDIDQLSLRQTQLQDRKNINQVAVDVSNQVIGLKQARAQYLAAVRNRILQEQLLSAEQKKFALGASIPYNVVTQQRALALAKSTEVASEVTYSNSRVALSGTLGTTLEDYHVSLPEAQAGRVARQSVLTSTPQP